MITNILLRFFKNFLTQMYINLERENVLREELLKSTAMDKIKDMWWHFLLKDYLGGHLCLFFDFFFKFAKII